MLWWPSVLPLGVELLLLTVGSWGCPRSLSWGWRRWAALAGGCWLSSAACSGPARELPCARRAASHGSGRKQRAARQSGLTTIGIKRALKTARNALVLRLLCD